MTVAADAETAAAVRHEDMANAIRALTMDAVAAAASGHSGMPMGMADIATVLATRFMAFDPADPAWPDRDRLVVSNGHGSMLIYALGYLLGYEGMDLDQIRNFRQLGYRTAGHPEWGHAPGVETTTGPLGQGLANAVGMAIAEAHLAARHGAELVDHRTYVLAGDGCLMEGISQEAIALAGHLKLRKLIVLFDDNAITIDGRVSLADSTDQRARFEASGWASLAVDGHDPAAVAAALETAHGHDRPTLIACKTTIGQGFPTQADTAKAHGAITDPGEIAGARERLGWPHPAFEVPEPILTAWRAAGARGQAARRAWTERLAAAPGRAAFQAALDGEVGPAVGPAIATLKQTLAADPPTQATRKASQTALEAINAVVPITLSGSADLTGSNNTKTEGMEVMSADNYAGRYIHYGVREHAMAAAMNGLALHGGAIPYGGTFMVFSDYARPALRLAALMGIRVVFVFTHDSIGVGEDGPTHQPVEHLAALRAIPNLQVFRPADAIETAECWQAAITSHGPSVMALTRQSVAPVRRAHTPDNLSAKGAYVLAEPQQPARATLLATGSEVSLAVAAAETLAREGTPARVVSMPCWERFEAQPDAYRAAVLGAAPRIAVEAAVRQGWDRYIGEGGGFVGMTGFGVSAPGATAMAHFGFTPEGVAAEVRRVLAAADR